MDFWDRVQLELERENTTYAYLAKKLGKRESTISGWHRGSKKIMPPVDNAVVIARILHTTVEYLVTGTAPEGLPPDILAIARKLAALEPPDREELDALIDFKLSRTRKATPTPFPILPPLEVHEPEPDYGVVEPVPSGTFRVPLRGSTAAGRPLDFGDLDPDPPLVSWDASYIHGSPRNYYCVSVHGSSMTEAGIMDGDIALLRVAEKAENGAIMLVRHGDASTLKRVRVEEGPDGREEGWICWEDGSGHRERLAGEDIAVQGRLAGIQRKG